MVSPKIIRSGRVLEFSYKNFEPNDAYDYYKFDSSPTARSRRSMMALRRKISSNAGQWFRADGSSYWPIFATLTFAKDVSVQVAREQVYLFFKRVNFKVFGKKNGVLKYSYVIEFTKAGRPHFHVLMYNLPFIPNFKAEFESMWRNGFVRINKVNDVRNVGAYVTKYMSKDFHKTKLGSRGRLYCNARNLLTPQVYNDADDCKWWSERVDGVWPWLYRRTPFSTYKIYYLGEDGLPMSLSPPPRPKWLAKHDDGLAW